MFNLIRKARAERGFTLVEIMIVVLIIGILLAIAVPNFVKARESSRAKSCVANLKQIDAAKEQWAMDTHAAGDATPSWDDLTPNYIKKQPACPSQSVSDPDNPDHYYINDMATPPSCKSGISAHSL